MLRWCSLHILNLGIDLWAGASCMEMLLEQDIINAQSFNVFSLCRCTTSWSVLAVARMIFGPLAEAMMIAWTLPTTSFNLGPSNAESRSLSNTGACRLLIAHFLKKTKAQPATVQSWKFSSRRGCQTNGSKRVQCFLHYGLNALYPFKAMQCCCLRLVSLSLGWRIPALTTTNNTESKSFSCWPKWCALDALSSKHHHPSQLPNRRWNLAEFHNVMEQAPQRYLEQSHCDRLVQTCETWLHE